MCLVQHGDPARTLLLMLGAGQCHLRPAVLTQMALARAQHQRKGPRRVAVLHKAHRPATTGQDIGIGSSMPDKRDTMSGSSTITPTPIIPPLTAAPNAGGNPDQKTRR